MGAVVVVAVGVDPSKGSPSFAPIHFSEKLDDFSEFVHEGGVFECFSAVAWSSASYDGTTFYP